MLRSITATNTARLRFRAALDSSARGAWRRACAWFIAMCVALFLAAGCRMLTMEEATLTDPVDQPTLELLASQLRSVTWTENRNWKPLTEGTDGRLQNAGPLELRWSLNGVKIAERSAESDQISAGPPTVESDSQSRLEEPQLNSQDEDSVSAVDELVVESDVDANEPLSATDATFSGAEPTEAGPQLPAIESATETADADFEHTPGVGTSWDGFWPLTGNAAIDAAVGEQPRNGRSPSADEYLRLLARRNDVVGWNAAILLAQRSPSLAAEVSDSLRRLILDPPSYDPQDLQGGAQVEDLEEANQASNDRGRMPAWLEPILMRGSALDSESEESVADAGEGENKKPATRREVPIPESMRAAAAEAWCLVLAATEESPIDGLAAAGRLLERTDLSVAVRAELFRGIARWIPAGYAIPRLANALRRSETGGLAPVPIRRAAIDAYVLQQLATSDVGSQSSDQIAHQDARSIERPVWPETIMNCQYDPDLYVQKMFGIWLAVAQHPRALEILKKQADGNEWTVRREALISLGRLGTSDAKAELKDRFRQSTPKLREAALRGLAYWGPREIAGFVTDDALTVRLAAIEELGERPGAEATAALMRVLDETHHQVQGAVVKAVAQWPDDVATPILLAAMRDGRVSARHQALLQLRRRIGSDVLFSADADSRGRAIAIDRLIADFNLSSMPPLDPNSASVEPQQDFDEFERRRLDDLLQELEIKLSETAPVDVVVEELIRIGRPDVVRIEERLQTVPPSVAEVLYNQVLPELSKVYHALAELESNIVEQRRLAARELSYYGRQSSLPKGAVLRLRETLVHEQDKQVWQSAMAAIEADNTAEAAQIALLAINNNWPDIRILGCRYIGRHRHPEQAVWLFPILDDPNKSVQHEAILAAGLCHNPQLLDGYPGTEDREAAGGLRQFLLHTDNDLSFAAIISMSRLGDAQAMRELMRLSMHDQWKIRLEAVTQMGLSGRTRFVDHLIRTAWTERNSVVRNGILQSLSRLIPKGERPSGLADASDTDHKISLWVRWWESRRPIKQGQGEQLSMQSTFQVPPSTEQIEPRSAETAAR